MTFFFLESCSGEKLEHMYVYVHMVCYMYIKYVRMYEVLIYCTYVHTYVQHIRMYVNVNNAHILYLCMCILHAPSVLQRFDMILISLENFLAQL